MWRQSDDGTLLRVLPNQQVDFFVRQIKDERSRREELVTLNDRFTITPEAGFAPADVDPAEAGWHRIDGISRKWVLLKPDAATEEAILDGRSPRGLDGRRLFTFPLDSRPPEFNEYPVEWQPLLRIPNEGHGIAVLSAGADEFARASDASAAAVEAALQTEL
jgi:hypothetical protein